MDIHHLILLGRSTKDAEIIETKNDKRFAKFSLAINEYNSSLKEEKNYYYDILVFGKSMEKVVEMVKKGDTVLVNGKPGIDIYISKKDNKPKGSITVLAESWKVLKSYKPDEDLE